MPIEQPPMPIGPLPSARHPRRRRPHRAVARVISARPPSQGARHRALHGTIVMMIASCLLGAACSSNNDGASPSFGTGGAAEGGSGGTNSTGSGGVTGGHGGGSGGVVSPGSGGNAGAAGLAGSEGDSGSAGDGGSGGTAGSGGAGGVAGSGSADSGVVGGDTPAARPLNITATAARYEHTFRTKDADPTVTFNDNTEIAVVDNRAAKMMGKLVLPFAGLGTTAGTMGAGGDFCGHRGFHVLAIAAYQNFDILIGDANFYGDARKEVFDGIEHTHTGAFANIHMTPADGVAQRTQKALQYLQKTFPTEDWGYFLNADGSVRWSDVIFDGMSHGASNSARFGMLVRASRVVSVSGPRDNMCTSLNANNCGGVIGSWLYEIPQTPIDRFYALTGVNDDQHTQHLFAMQLLNYVGQPVNVIGMQPPYGGSHRLVASAGHVDYCGQAAYKAACNYMFGVPTENQDGTP